MSAARNKRPRIDTTSHTGTPRPQPIPDDETQRLYNDMRDASVLLTPSSARSPAMSRSPSATSSCSLANGIENIAFLDPPSPATNTRRRRGRRGPLIETTKASAAFFRKVGVCPDCHRRKVKCPLSHHDLSLFEESYAASKRPEREQPPQEHQFSLFHPLPAEYRDFDLISLAATGNTSSRQDFTPRPAMSLDLLGIGGEQGSQPTPQPQAATEEINGLLLAERFPNMPVSPMLETSPIPVIPSWDVSPLSYGAPGDYTYEQLVSSSRPPHVTIRSCPGANMAMTEDDVSVTSQQSDIPIGRLVDSNTDLWECQGDGSIYGGGSRSTSSFLSVPTASGPCLRRISSLRELQRHFQLEHCSYNTLARPFLFKCSVCDFKNPEFGPQCPACDSTQEGDGLLWERWYYGCIFRAESLAPEPAFPVRQGPGAHTYSFPGQHGHHSFNNPSQPPSGLPGYLSPRFYDVGDGGRGRHRWHGEKSKPRPDSDGAGNSDDRPKKRSCPLRRLVSSDKACGWRQPSRGHSRSRSRSRSCSPTESSCPISAAGRPALKLLVSTSRWLFPLLLLLLLIVTSAGPCASSLGLSSLPADDAVGGCRPLVAGPLSHHALHSWLLWAAAAALGTWLLRAVSVGQRRLGRLRPDEGAGVVSPGPVAALV